MSCDHTCSAQEMIKEAKQGNQWALEALLRMHRGMIVLLAGRLCRESISLEELIQAGTLGFIRALRNYDASQNARLITYAVPWILGEMRRSLKRIENSTYSLDCPVDENGGLTLHDVLAGEDGLNIQHIDLRLALEKLSQEEQILICMRYYRDKTQHEAAVLLGKSQAQVSRIERRALDALHHLLN